MNLYYDGQLYIDLLELSELPDMALSNRQGCKSDDPRYIAVINFCQANTFFLLSLTCVLLHTLTLKTLTLRKRKSSIMQKHGGR